MNEKRGVEREVGSRGRRKGIRREWSGNKLGGEEKKDKEKGLAMSNEGDANVGDVLDQTFGDLLKLCPYFLKAWIHATGCIKAEGYINSRLVS